MQSGGKPKHVKRARSPQDPALDRRIRQIMDQYGLERAEAAQVARGRADLNEVIARLAMNVEVDSLMRRHDLSRALATQIARKQANLEQVLNKRRMQAHVEANHARSLLDPSSTAKEPIFLVLHGGRQAEGRVLAVHQYEFEFQENGKDPETIHKLKVMYGCLAVDRKKVRRLVRADEVQKAASTGPIEKPQDRYTCSNQRLFGYLRDKKSVDVTLLEGDRFTGEVEWIGRFEIGLRLKGNIDVVIFRHALAHVGD